ncbi:uncharacterized protein LOC126278174 [Schistocerca gregaria]|uniref:uncharacterized protein LOC126278174 n=1 Tax=Schistocerca gregaria TaxID=7010 RepID=UPI00211E3C91|nr:uncharacterized protein LOC126278174 [Schistocerca gregaria]XP_049834028.1 uncharacterized protein LOC126278174 [Schistocerca gregaria]
MMMSLLSLVALLATVAADVDRLPLLPSQAASPPATTSDGQWHSPDHSLPDDDDAFPATPTTSPTAAETRRRLETSGTPSAYEHVFNSSTFQGEQPTPEDHTGSDKTLPVIDAGIIYQSESSASSRNQQIDDHPTLHEDEGAGDPTEEVDDPELNGPRVLPRTGSLIPTTEESSEDGVASFEIGGPDEERNMSESSIPDIAQSTKTAEGLLDEQQPVAEDKATDPSVYEYKWDPSYAHADGTKDLEENVTNYTKNTNAEKETAEGDKVEDAGAPDAEYFWTGGVTDEQVKNATSDTKQVTSDRDSNDTRAVLSSTTTGTQATPSSYFQNSESTVGEGVQKTEETPLHRGLVLKIERNDSPPSASIPINYKEEPRTESPMQRLTAERIANDRLRESLMRGREPFAGMKDEFKDFEQVQTILKDSDDVQDSPYSRSRMKYYVDDAQHSSRADIPWRSGNADSINQQSQFSRRGGEQREENATESKFVKDVQSSRQETIEIMEDKTGSDPSDEEELPSSTLSITEQEAGIQVYITFTQASESPRAEGNSRSSNPTERPNPTHETGTTRKADLMSMTNIHKGIDGVESYVIPSLDFEETSSTELSHESGGVPDGSSVTSAQMTTGDGGAQVVGSEGSKGNGKSRQYDASNPYRHWDVESEEQERVMKTQRRTNNGREGPMYSGIEDASRDDTAPAGGNRTNGHSNTTSRSYLLLLAGNSTIVKMRQKDFAKYLKLNLAARLSLEYDDVKVNRVVLAPPRLLVNVSVVTPPAVTAAERVVAADEDAGIDAGGGYYGGAVPAAAAAEVNVVEEEAPLHKLARANATLLELSGEEYHIVRLLPLHSRRLPPPPEFNDSLMEVEGGGGGGGGGGGAGTAVGADTEYREEQPDVGAPSSSRQEQPERQVLYRHDDIELIIYTAVGSACAVAIVATAFITVSRYLRVTAFQWPWRSPKTFSKAPWILPNHHHPHHSSGRHSPPHYRMDEEGLHPTVIYSGAFAAAHNVGGSMCGSTGPSSWADEYQPPLPDRASLPAHCGLPLFGPGGDPGSSSALYSDVVQQSPRSKLHLFSCRPGSLLLPIAPPQSPLKSLPSRLGSNNNNNNNNQQQQSAGHLKGKLVGGLDNPNYEK